MPMAGKGTRLQNFDSYPKPLVKILGKTIVEWSIDTLGLEGNFIFCCKKEHIEKFEIDKLLTFHRSHGKALTVTGVRPPGRFGELVVEGQRVTAFNEKPQATDGRISGGFFVASPRLFDYLNDDDGLVFEQEPMRKLVADKELMVYEHNTFWQPMDTSRDYKFLNELYDKGKAPWVKW